MFLIGAEKHLKADSQLSQANDDKEFLYEYAR